MTTDVTLIGLGAMGSALAGGFLAAGHSVTGWNRSAGRADDLVARGAHEASSIEEAIAASPVIMTCLLNYDVTRALLDSPDVRPLLAGRTVINAAGASPDEVSALVASVHAAGAGCLEAKLMMYPGAVGDDDTVVYYSGKESLFEAHRPLLTALGGRPTYLGEIVTAAATTYQAVWTVYYSALFGFMESAALMRRSGLTVESFLPHALRGLADATWHFEDVTRRLARGDFSGDEAALVTYVDGFKAMRGTFQEAGTDSLMMRSMQELLAAGEKAGYGEEDVAVLVEMLSNDQETS